MNEINWRERWSSTQIRTLLTDQLAAFGRMATGVERSRLGTLVGARTAPHVVVVSGLRRAGKSTLLAQLADQIGHDAYHYLNFEDERFLGFRAEDMHELLQDLVEHFGERPTLIVDEIQNVPGWERVVRRLSDQGLKIYVTGSNASLLSKELGDRLTGRHIPVSLFPFDFREYLRFRGSAIQDSRARTSEQAASLRGRLGDYLRDGGIPDPLKHPDLQLRRWLYDDVLYRDIAARHRISELGALRELAHFLMSQPACLVSYNKLKSRLGLGSVNTVKSYVDHLQDSWLLFTTNVFDASLKRQQVAPKKVYAIDTGLARDVGFALSPNAGRMLENLVFLALRRRTERIHYYRNADGTDVDLYLPEERRLIQVAQRIDQPETRERELRALDTAMRELDLGESWLLTETGGDPIEVEGRTVHHLEIATWLLGEARRS